MIEHDEDWLSNIEGHHSDLCWENALAECRAYHEHMQRLRPVTDPLPYDGDMVEIHCIDKKGVRTIKLATMDASWRKWIMSESPIPKIVGWRPFGLSIDLDQVALRKK